MADSRLCATVPGSHNEDLHIIQVWFHELKERSWVAIEAQVEKADCSDIRRVLQVVDHWRGRAIAIGLTLYFSMLSICLTVNPIVMHFMSRQNALEGSRAAPGDHGSLPAVRQAAGPSKNALTTMVNVAADLVQKFIKGSDAPEVASSGFGELLTMSLHELSKILCLHDLIGRSESYELQIIVLRCPLTFCANSELML